MANDKGFSKLRNGIRAHYKKGKFSPATLGIYTYLQMECDWATGIYHGSALGIAFGFDNQQVKQSIQRSLATLRQNGYINYRKGDGAHGGYDILIHKYEPQLGKLSGKRLNAWKRGDKCIPVWEDKTDDDTDVNTDGDIESKRNPNGGAADRDKVTRPIPEVTEYTDSPNVKDLPDDNQLASLSVSVAEQRNTDETEKREPIDEINKPEDKCSHDAKRLCKYFTDRSGNPLNSHSYPIADQLLTQLDYEHARQVIDWIFNDEFWTARTHNMKNLYDHLIKRDSLYAQFDRYRSALAKKATAAVAADADTGSSWLKGDDAETEPTISKAFEVDEEL